MKLYGRSGLIICVILMDMDFEKVAEIMVNIEFNIALAREQVVEVERMTRTVKDHGRGILNTLTY